MSNQVDTAMVDEFNAGFIHLSQQMECRFSGKVREETQNSESQFWDQISPTVAQKKTGRHSDTPLIHTPHDRRRCTLEDYEWADLVDKADKIRMISDPAGDYLKAAVAAMNRAKDDEVIQAFSATAYTGRSGGTAVELTAANVLVAHKAGDDSVQYLNEKTLRAAAQYFDENEAANDGETKYIAVNAKNLYNGLLADNAITNSDFAAIKALVRGEVDQFMGFDFIRTERLQSLSALSSKARYSGIDGATDFNPSTGELDLTSTGDIVSADCVVLPCWVKNGVLKAQGQDVETRITERGDKSYSVQPFASMSIGATRMEENKCLEIIASNV